MTGVLTLKHGLFLGVAHCDSRGIWLLLVDPNGRLDFSKLALVDQLLLLAPLPVQQFAADQALVLHL